MEENKLDTVARKTALLEMIQRAGAMQPADRRELADMLRRPALQRALYEVLVESDANATVLMGINLEDPTDRARGAKAQGVAYGLLRAVERVIDIAFEEEDNARSTNTTE